MNITYSLPRLCQIFTNTPQGEQAVRAAATGTCFNPVEVIRRTYRPQCELRTRMSLPSGTNLRSRGLSTFPPSFKPKTSRSNVIFAFGPGDKIWDHQFIHRVHKSLERSREAEAVSSFSVLGDGNTALSVDALMEVVKTTKEKQLPITLLIQAHGSSKDFEHYLFFGDAPITSRKLFKRLKGVLSEEYPISIFTISCHGNVAAQAAQEELPKGSTFVALSRGGDPVYMSDVQRFIDQTMRVSASWHNIENILYSYLTPLEYKFTPSITYVPNEPLDLGGVLQNQGDKKSSEEQKERVVQRLQDFIPAPEIRRIIGTIESQRQKINDLSSVKYGLTLAVALALRNCEKIDRNH